MRKTGATVLILMLIGLISIIAYNLYYMYKNIDIQNSNYKTEKIAVSTEDVENMESINNNLLIEDVLENTIQSVVGISRLKSSDGSILKNVSSEDLGLGTGVIINENGYILSNSHVTGDKFSICYVTIDENTYKGLVVFSEPDLDLSIVKVNANNLKSIDLGDSSKIKVGNKVYAIGNPIGYEFKRTVTSGIISAVNRTIKIEEGEEESYISDLIQTDATINPGNSGGPLINSKGEVIGINTVKITSAEGIGFAIPINVIKPVVESIIQNGKFEEATLGIYAYDSEVAEYMKLKNKGISGIYISQLLPNGPASNVDLKEGDLIISIDNKRLKTINDLREYLYRKEPRR
ncbi:MAG TPA: peptidase S1 [Clostridiales bacterium]|nr:peptidase S1 [Clostridiales bacterium]